MRPIVIALSLCLSLLPSMVAMADTTQDESIILDDEDEEGFGIPLWGNKAKSEAKPSKLKQPASTKAETAKEETVGEDKPECVILDDEDEDEDGVCGIAIRFPGDAKSREQAAKAGKPAYDPELYRVVLDEEDETNESGFGIPLPTEENPTPWNGPDSKPLSEEERFDDE